MTPITSTNIGLGPQIAISATGTSNVIRTEGRKSGSVGLTSDHAGTLQVQRYVDAFGVTALAAVLSVVVVAATPVSVGWSDGLPSGSLVVKFVNSAGAVANLTNIIVNLTT